MLLQKHFFIVQCLPFIGAGAGVGAGEKNTRRQSRSKTERLRNTANGWVWYDLPNPSLNLTPTFWIKKTCFSNNVHILRYDIRHIYVFTFLIMIMIMINVPYYLQLDPQHCFSVHQILFFPVKNSRFNWTRLAWGVYRRKGRVPRPPAGLCGEDGRQEDAAAPAHLTAGGRTWAHLRIVYVTTKDAYKKTHVITPQLQQSQGQCCGAGPFLVGSGSGFW